MLGSGEKSIEAVRHTDLQTIKIGFNVLFTVHAFGLNVVLPPWFEQSRDQSFLKLIYNIYNIDDLNILHN